MKHPELSKLAESLKGFDIKFIYAKEGDLLRGSEPDERWVSTDPIQRRYDNRQLDKLFDEKGYYKGESDD